MNVERVKRNYWLATALALAAHLGGWGLGLPAALAVTAAHALHFAWRGRSVRTLPVQVRLAYLCMLAIGAWAPLSWLHVLLLAGVSLLLAIDYCALARLLLLAPWNRPVPLSAAYVHWLLVAPPTPGSIVDRIPDALRGPAAVQPDPSGLRRFPTRSEDAGKRIA
jgi:hypothetical protein